MVRRDSRNPSRPLATWLVAGLALVASQSANAQPPTLEFLDNGDPAAAVLDRSHAELRLVDTASNLDSALIETVFATVLSAATGDSEAVALEETGPASGIFHGRFQISPEPAAHGDGLVSSQWRIQDFAEAEDRLDATAAGASASADVESVRGGFVDRYGRATDSIALGEVIYARLHVAGVDAPLDVETLSFTVRDATGGDRGETNLEDPSIVDIYDGGDLVTAPGPAVDEDGVLQTAIGRQLSGTFNQIVTTVNDVATVTASRTALVDAVSRPVVTRRPGQELFIEVFDAAVTGGVTVTVDAGATLDQETVTLADLGGGLFRGSVATAAGTATAGDGTLDLDALGGETVTASYADGHGGSSESLVTLAQAPTRSALFVVGQTALGAGDQAVFDHLVDRGWVLTVVDDGTSQTADAASHDLVLISSTVSSNQVGSKFRAVTVPVLNWEPYVLDDLAMAGTTASLDYGSEPNQTQVSIRDAAHPLAGGLAGSVTVAGAAGVLTYGRSGGAAAGIARVGGRPERLSVFGYEKGDAMVGLNAPARRVSTFLSDTTAATLTADGWRLFDAAVCWAVRCDGEPLARFTATPGGPGGRTVTFDTSASQAFDGANLVDFEWTFGDGGSATDDGPDHKYQPPFYSDEHGFLATLTVTDSLGRSSTFSRVMWLSPHSTVLVIARTELLDAGDAAVVERLRLHGHRAFVVGHSGLSPADADGHGSVFISSSAQSSQVGATFKDVAVPVAVWETNLFDDMALTAPGGSNFGRDLGQPGLDFLDVFHPITEFGSFSGLTEVDALGQVGWGKPGADADVLATSPADASHAALFAYDDHHVLADGVRAPHRRVGVWFGDNSAAALTHRGRELLDQIIDWTVAP